jgi:hypothetical protein
MEDNVNSDMEHVYGTMVLVHVDLDVFQLCFSRVFMGLD